jgi:hypothetical protein
VRRPDYYGRDKVTQDARLARGDRGIRLDPLTVFYTGGWRAAHLDFYTY